MKQLYRVIARIYVFVFGRSQLQFINKMVLRLALCARGYSGVPGDKAPASCDVISACEARFIKVVSTHLSGLCIDIGANKGQYSAALLEATTARIIAFEPLPGAYQELVALSDKYPGRLLAVNKGVGDKNVELELYYGDEDSKLASFSSEVNEIPYVGASNVHSILVPMVTLDEYFLADKRLIPNSGIDLIKIDTEGYEYNVLLGAQILVATVKPRFIQIEYNLHQLIRSHSLYSISLLLSGYNIYQLLPHGRGLFNIDPKHPESNIYHYSNFVFVRSDLTM